MAANSIARLAVLITGDASPLQTSLRSAGQSVQAFSGSFGGGVSSAALSGPYVAAAAAATAAAAAVIGFAKAGIEGAASMEQARISFEVMTGSASTAAAMIDELRGLAAESPLNFADIQQAAKVLLAMGEDSRLVVDDIEMLGHVASGSGQNLVELAQVFGQVMQAGRLTGNELRQFNERGIPLLTTLADQMGVSKQAIRDMVEEGAIGSADVVKAFQKMTGEGGIFANMMGRQADTLSGQWEKFKENLQIIATETMKNFANALKDILTEVNRLLDAWIRWFGLERQRSKQSKEGAEEVRKQIDAQNAAAKAAEEAAEKQKAALKEQEQALERAKSRADSISKSLRTPSEIYRDTMTELRDLFQDGLLSIDMFVRGTGKAKKDLDDALKTKKEIDKSPDRVGAVERFTQAGFSAAQRSGESKKLEENTRRTADNTGKAARALQELIDQFRERTGRPGLTESNF